MSNVIPLRPLPGAPHDEDADRQTGMAVREGTVVRLRLPNEEYLSPTIRLTAAEINAYIDGNLSDEQRMRIDKIIRTDPEAATVVRHYRHQVDELHRLYDPVLSEPVPSAMTDLLRRAGKPKSTAADD